MIALFTSALLAQQSQQLGVYDLGGERVPVALPTWKSDRTPPQYLDAGGYRYFFSGGNLVGRAYGTGEWSDVPNLLSKASSASVTEWPLTFFVSAESEVLERTEHGFWGTKRAVIENDELRLVRKEVALFCELVKGYTGGRIAIKPSFEVDTEVITVPIGQSVAERTLEQVISRLSPTTRSAIVLTSELKMTDERSPFTPVPVSYVPVFPTLDPQVRGKLARHLLATWTVQVAETLARGGIKLGDLSQATSLSPGRAIDFSITPDESLRGASIWAALAKPDNFGVETTVPSGTRAWSEVSDDPWVKLPRLSKEEVKAHGVTDFAAKSQGTAQFGNWRVVQDRYVDLVGEKSGLKAIGCFPLGGRTVVAFEGGESAATDAQLIGSPALQDSPATSGSVSLSLPFNAGDAEKLDTGGFWLVSTIADADRGAVAEIRELPRPRKSWLRLIGNGSTAKAIDLAKTPYLDFWIKPRIIGQPVDLVAEGPGIKTRIRLFGRAYETEARRGVPKDYLDLGLTQSSDWQFVSLDLRAMGSGEISNLYLMSPPESFDWSNFGTTFQILLDDVKVTDKASGALAELKKPTAVPAISESTDPLSRAAAAQNADPETLVKLISDSNSLVALNALIAYGDKNLPSAEKALTDGTKSLSHRISQMSMDALARSGSADAKTLIASILKMGPFDHMKRSAASVITTFRTDRTLAADLSILLASRSWQTRLAAGLATPRLEGDTAKIVGMAFVNDPEPFVRYMIVEDAHLEVKEVEARVISLLDPAVESSPLVRVAAALKLSSTKLSVVTKFLGAESRLAKMLCISLADKVKHQELLKFLSADANEEVKQAALTKLG
ncbi:MAG: hypothetical protein ABL949_15405 [Fimbriimonadaceae bacterium]